jgi:hypothetical protein
VKVWPTIVAALAPDGARISVAAAATNPSEKRLRSLPLPLFIKANLRRLGAAVNPRHSPRT